MMESHLLYTFIGNLFLGDVLTIIIIQVDRNALLTIWRRGVIHQLLSHLSWKPLLRHTFMGIPASVTTYLEAPSQSVLIEVEKYSNDFYTMPKSNKCTSKKCMRHMLHKKYIIKCKAIFKRTLDCLLLLVGVTFNIYAIM